MAQLARAGWICLFVPVRHSFLKRAVANHMAHKLFSLVRFDIQGNYPIHVSNRSILDFTFFDRQRYGFDALFYASKLHVGHSNDVEKSSFLFETRMGWFPCKSKHPDPKSEAPMNRQLSSLVDAARYPRGFQRGPQTPLVGVIHKRAPMSPLVRRPRRTLSSQQALEPENSEG